MSACQKGSASKAPRNEIKISFRDAVVQ